MPERTAGDAASPQIRAVPSARTMPSVRAVPSVRSGLRLAVSDDPPPENGDAAGSWVRLLSNSVSNAAASRDALKHREHYQA